MANFYYVDGGDMIRVKVCILDNIVRLIGGKEVKQTLISLDGECLWVNSSMLEVL